MAHVQIIIKRRKQNIEELLKNSTTSIRTPPTTAQSLIRTHVPRECSPPHCCWHCPSLPDPLGTSPAARSNPSGRSPCHDP
jgi:hypothetical protein